MVPEPIHVRIHDLALAVRGDGPRARQTAAALLAHFGASSDPGPADVAVELRIGPSPTPPVPRSASHAAWTIGEGPGEVWIWGLPGVARVGRERVELTLVDDVLPLALFAWVLVAVWRVRARFAVHAACVAEGGRGAVVVGPSGAGKSTFALAMVGQGLHLVSDDSVLLAGSEVWALRRGAFLHPDAAARHFPAWAARLRPSPLLEGEKHALDPAALAGHTAERCVPARLVLPTVSGAVHTTADECSPGDALFALAAESRLAEMEPSGAAAQLAALSGLVASTPAVRVALGRDVLVDPTRVADRVRRWLGGGRP